VREELRAAVLSWYRPRRRAYAWRRGRRDPYRTLVSEVMLQQTQAARVEPIFVSFLDRFPDVGALARGSRADVLRAWGALGYNRRAVRLHDAARAIVRDHGGRIPRDPTALRALPGVGPYTAAAVASIGFGDPMPALDTNVRRVVARALLGAEPGDVAAEDLSDAAARWLDPAAPADWNQALMDLGRACCRPAPRCDACPLATACRWRLAGRPTRSAARRTQPFRGSSREARGAIVRALRARRSLPPAAIAPATGIGRRRIAAALDGLLRDGLVERTRAGSIRLPER
jgi:A/G-specific adenine glycosylase